LEQRLHTGDAVSIARFFRGLLDEILLRRPIPLMEQ
jgi:hypothetical protein